MEICPLIERNHRLDEDPEGVEVDKGRYQHLVRRRIYFSLIQILVTLSVWLARLMHAPRSFTYVCGLLYPQLFEISS